MHLVLKPPALILCNRCGSPKSPHMVCSECGFYRGRQVIDVLAKLDKKEKKKKEKEMKEMEKAQRQEKQKIEELKKEELSRK